MMSGRSSVSGVSGNQSSSSVAGMSVQVMEVLSLGFCLLVCLFELNKRQHC